MEIKILRRVLLNRRVDLVHPTHWLISTQAKARPRPRLAGAARGDGAWYSRERRRTYAKWAKGRSCAVRRRDAVQALAPDARRRLR